MVFLSCYAIFHQQYMRIPVVPYPCQHLVLSVFILAMLKGYVVASHFCFNLHLLMTNDVEHLFMCILDTHVSSFVKYLFK